MNKNPHEDEQFFDPGTSDEPMQGFAIVLGIWAAVIAIYIIWRFIA